MKVTTTISISNSIKTKAKKQGINISEATEEALLKKLNDPTLLEQLEAKRKHKLKEARELKHQIDELKEMQRRKEEVLGNKEERLEKSMETIFRVLDNDGTIDEERIGYIAKSNELLFDEVMDEYKIRLAEKQG